MTPDNIVRNARWREEFTSLSDILLSLHNTVQTIANSQGVSKEGQITYQALALSTAEPLVTMSDEGLMHPQDVVYVLACAALFVHIRYCLLLQSLAPDKE